MNTNKKRSPKFFIKIIKMMIFVLVMQTLFFIVSINIAGAYENLNNSSVQLFDEKNDYKRKYIENEFVSRWMNLSVPYNEVNNNINSLLIKENKTYDDLISNEQALSVEALNQVSDGLFKTLNSNAVTGVFIVFGNDTLTNKYGLYIRDSDPLLVVPDYSNIVVEVAPQKYNNELKLMNSSYKNTKFQFTNYTEEQLAFFTKPINAKQNNKALSYSDCGYISSPYILNNESIELITYSVPLISSSGIIYGVLGIDISLRYLKDLLPFSDIEPNNNGYYILAKEVDEKLLANNLIISGMEPQDILNICNNNKSDFKITSFDHVFLLKNDNKDIYVSYHQLNLYNANGPFSDEQWSLIAVIDASVIHQNANKLNQIVFITLTLSFALSILLIGISSIVSSKPIVNLTEELVNSPTDSYLKLSRVNIEEIDNLINAIEVLNKEVIDAESKLSKIINLVDLPVVAFEYNVITNRVYTSRNISEILKIDHKNDYIIEDFKNLINNLKPYIVKRKDNEYTYKYHDYDNKNHWIEVKFIDESKSGIIKDVTNDYLEREKLLIERNYDSLTNMFNRRAFQDRYENIFDGLNKGYKAAFVMFDLDNLKYINDTYGHDFGDSYIKESAKVIIDYCKDKHNMLYGRRSGDEFYIFMFDMISICEIENEIAKIHDSFKATRIETLDSVNLKIRISSGYAIYPDDTKDKIDLIKYADFAMYETKNSIKGYTKRFDLESYDKNAYLLTNNEELNNLIDNELVDFYYQPIVDLNTGDIYGYESLMRSLIPSFRGPDEILRIAKAQHKLHEIEKLTFSSTLKKYTQNEDILKNKKIFINAIPNHPLNIDEIFDIESKYKNILHNIVVEITEYERLDDVNSKKIREKLSTWNAQIALDDFGSGYNGEALLLEINPNFVKIDMALIRNIHIDKDRQQIVKNMISYAKKRNIKVIAEGIEVADELKYLMNLGCDYVQGYFLGRPNSIPQEVASEALEIINSKKV